MKELRKHLDAAKGEYTSARYPGDLAAQVFSQRQTSRNGRRVVAVMFAVAAVLFMIMWMNVPQRTGRGGSDLAQADPQIDEIEPELTNIGDIFVMSELPAMSMPATPDEMEFAPVTPEFSVTVPSFSLLGNDTSEEESNPEEQV